MSLFRLGDILLSGFLTESFVSVIQLKSADKIPKSLLLNQILHQKIKGENVSPLQQNVGFYHLSLLISLHMSVFYLM